MKKLLLLFVFGISMLNGMEQSTDFSQEIESLFEEAADEDLQLSEDETESQEAERKEFAYSKQKEEGNKKNIAGNELVSFALRAHIRLGNIEKVRGLILNGAQLSSDDFEKALRSLNVTNPNKKEQMNATIKEAQQIYQQAQSE